jgi:hypothetical protein
MVGEQGNTTAAAAAATPTSKPSLIAWVAPLALVFFLMSCSLLTGAGRLFGPHVSYESIWPAPWRPYVYAAALGGILVIAASLAPATAFVRALGSPATGAFLSRVVAVAGRILALLCFREAIVALRIYAPDSGRSSVADFGLLYLTAAPLAVALFGDLVAAWWRRLRTRRTAAGGQQD